MTFDWHVLYPLHTLILDNSPVFWGCSLQSTIVQFFKVVFQPPFWVVPIWELWQFCYVRIGPPKYEVPGSVLCEDWVRAGNVRSATTMASGFAALSTK